jgi:hypothetical protein
MAIFLTIVVVVIVLSILHEKRRREAMQRAAIDMGLEYQAEGTGLAGRLGALPLFDRGRSKRAGNVLSGTIEDLELHLFDYRYTTGSGKNRSTHHQTVAAFSIPGADLPTFRLAPETIFHKIGAAMGMQDIDFDGHPEFSKRYVLSGNDEKSIREIFTPEVVAFLESIPRVHAEASGTWLIVFRTGRRVKVEKLHEFLDEAFTVCNRLTRPVAEATA